MIKNTVILIQLSRSRSLDPVPYNSDPVRPTEPELNTNCIVLGLATVRQAVAAVIAVLLLLPVHVQPRL